jgi:surfactin synthase thioesterase subunit
LRNLIDPTNPNQEYDIIYVNWTNGTDDIKENAKVLKAVIDWVNTNKQGDEPNVLLGQSMGGLIGRYTLAKMEKDGQHHDVRLFIAHDSPKVSEKSKLLKIPSKI